VGPVASGLGNTLSAAFAGRDHTEPYRVHSGSLGLSRSLTGGWEALLGGRVEYHESARLSVESGLIGSEFRPVIPIDEGISTAGTVRVLRAAPAHLGRAMAGSGSITVGRHHGSERCVGACLDGATYLKPEAEATWARRWESRQAELLMTGRGGLALGTLPVQELYLLGGRGTVPGYDFRSFGGDRFALVRAAAAADLDPTWLRLRVSGALGWSAVGAAAENAAARWPISGSGKLLPSIGLGLGMVHDILHLDLHRGLGVNGRWELIFEANPSFWDFL
jgi:hypothetical protein